MPNLPSIKSERVLAIEKIKSHPHHGKVYFALGPVDRKIVSDFIESFGHLPNDSFEMRINRIFLDCPTKPKRWAQISEVLSTVNSMSCTQPVRHREGQ